MITHRRVPMTLARVRQSQIRHELWQARRHQMLAEAAFKQGRTEQARHLLACVTVHKQRAEDYRALLEVIVWQPELLEAA